MRAKLHSCVAGRNENIFFTLLCSINVPSSRRPCGILRVMSHSLSFKCCAAEKGSLARECWADDGDWVKSPRSSPESVVCVC